MMKRNGAWIGFFALVLIMTALTHVLADTPFLSGRNITNLFRQAAINGVLACGMTYVILTGGIDLSIGSLVAFCGIVVAYTQVFWGWSDLGLTGAIGSLAVGLTLGAALGAVNGFLISWLKIPPFVITLGMMVIVRGAALIVSDGTGISPIGEDLKILGEGYIEGMLCALLLLLSLGYFFWQKRKNLIDVIFPGLMMIGLAYAFYDYKGFPVPALVLFLFLALSGFILTQTVFGRCVYALGSNEQAAYWAGVPIFKIKFLVYTIMGLLSGLAGAMLTARLNSAVPTAGGLFELDAIAAVVIGGTSLKGGTGSVVGSFVGALTIATLNNGMDMLGVPSFYQMVFKGMIIIAAVSLDKGQREA